MTYQTIPVSPFCPSTITQKLEGKLEEYQPTMTELSSSLERLRSEGRSSDADAVLRLTEQYELLIDRVTEHRQHCQAAIALRQALYDHAQLMDDSLRELEDQSAAISELGIAMPDRVVKYKVRWDACRWPAMLA